MEDPRLTKEAYWEAVKKQNLLPNFWMTDEYIEKAGLVWYRDSGWCGWTDPMDIGWFFPSLNSQGQFVTEESNIYSGFLQEGPIYKCINEELLDYQYIYDPSEFLTLEGHKWKAFRKILKQYRASTHAELLYLKIAPGYDYPLMINTSTFTKDITELLLKWAGEKEFFDNEVMIKYALEGENRWGLFADGKLVGLNIWDENFQFINYRYCIDNGTHGLNRYLRHQFYTHPSILSKQKYINDGGSLGDAGLREFKLRLNPHEVYTVTSYKQGDE